MLINTFFSIWISSNFVVTLYYKGGTTRFLPFFGPKMTKTTFDVVKTRSKVVKITSDVVYPTSDVVKIPTYLAPFSTNTTLSRTKKFRFSKKFSPNTSKSKIEHFFELDFTTNSGATQAKNNRAKVQAKKIPLSLSAKRDIQTFNLMKKTFERKTRLELATPTLARLCSTN